MQYSDKWNIFFPQLSNDHLNNIYISANILGYEKGILDHNEWAKKISSVLHTNPTPTCKPYDLLIGHDLQIITER